MKKHFYAFALSCTMLLGAMTGCDDKPETDPNPNPAGRVAVNLEADIAPPSTLKVANDQWEASDKVGLYMKKAGQTLTTVGAVYSDAANLQMSIAGGVLTSTPPVYYPLEGNVDFVAYYPYTATVGADYTIPVNVAGQATGLPVEVLYSNNGANRAPSVSAVPLNFRYSLAKLAVTVTGSANSALTAADFASMTVSVEGMYTQANLQLTDGTFTAHQGLQAIDLHKTGSTATSATFDALVLPATVAPGEIVFVFNLGGNSYRCPVNGDYNAAIQYGLSFNIDLPAPPERVATLLNAVIIPRTDESRDFTVTPEATGGQMTLTALTAGEVNIGIGGTGTMTIDWGDGSEKETHTLSDFSEHTHVYSGSSSRTITITGENVKMLRCAENQLIHLDVSNNTMLESLVCDNNALSDLDVSRNTMLTELAISANQLTSLDVSQNVVLRWMRCSRNQLTSLDMRNNGALAYLECDGNALTNLDVSNNTMLTELNCNDNQLTSLDMSNYTMLESLRCSGNPLTSLDVSKNAMLAILHCENDQLTNLDVSKNTMLESLNCLGNPLTSLDVSKNAMLRGLNCSNNQLINLDVSKNTMLESLNCSGNPLTSLDVSKNAMLTGLNCSNNQLTSLDVSKNTALYEVYCDGNQLMDLNVNNNPALGYISCANNLLTSLDVSNNSELRSINCANNSLTGLDVSANTALRSLSVQSNLLSESALNALFESMCNGRGPNYNDTLTITNNPGTYDCDVSIVTGKGWKVDKMSL